MGDFHSDIIVAGGCIQMQCDSITYSVKYFENCCFLILMRKNAVVMVEDSLLC